MGFFKSHNLLKLTQEDIKDMTSPIFDKHSTLIIQNLPQGKLLVNKASLADLNQTFKKEKLPILSKCS
jgi:23S rRNA G2445 N2-methylase RlmL